MNYGLAERVSTLLGGKEALAFSRGSAGLYALLAAIAKQTGVGEVIIPTLCCETVALAAIYAGHTVRFADVSPETFCVTPETVETLITNRTRAVIIVHLFGIDAQVKSFSALRDNHPSIVFVEDLAHALGGSGKDGRLLGSALDYTLVSFAESKILPGDGGLLIFGTESLAAKNLYSEIQLDAPRAHKPRLALSMRNLVHAIADLWRDRAGMRSPPIFLEMLEYYRDLIVAPGTIGDENAAVSGLEKLQINTAIRYRNYQLYRNGITSKSVSIPHLHEASTCWRCPLVFDSADKASIATAALRANGIPASNHYFPLSVLFGTSSCPQGENIALRIVNLWTDEKTSSDTIERSINIVNSY